ncbi:MAG: DNA alkylation repair protein [Bacteroidota bacterium]
MKEFTEIIEALKSKQNPDNLAGMARYGIKTDKAFGVSLPLIRDLAKRYKNNHPLALQLWQSGYHEARIFATLADNVQLVTEQQMEDWVLDFDSWDVCDQCCNNLFKKTPYAVKKALEWSGRPEEFVKRAGFVMMACLAVHSRSMPDEEFESFLAIIVREATDERNYVRKAVNWALREIGKRDMKLYAKALGLSRTLAERSDKTAHWIGRDAVSDLESGTAIRRMLHKDNLLKS